MTKQQKIDALLVLPVTNRPEAEAFIEALHDAELSYHFDDGAVDCLHGTMIDGKPLVTLEEAVAIDAKIAACYDAWRASGADLMDDCPIGHALKVMGHEAE